MNAEPPAAVAAREAIPEIPRLPSGKLGPAVSHACQSPTAVTDVLHETEVGRVIPQQARKACFRITRPTSANLPPASESDAYPPDGDKPGRLFSHGRISSLKLHYRT